MYRESVVFLAPGAGLGHIVRVSAIACSLAEKDIPSLILTTSKWAEALSKITTIPTISCTANGWGKNIYQYLSTTTASVVVQDTFPFGFRDENLECHAKKKQFIYLARYLKTADYFNRLNKKWDKLSPLLSTIIEIEPLENNHQKLISETSSKHFKLENRIRFPSEKLCQNIPGALQKSLPSKKLHLIVHSGPLHETERLIMIAKAQINNNPNEEVAIINPLFAAMKRKHSYDYFPAAALFPEVYRIYTGGGYNSVAETELFLEKTTYLSFPRHYDDQQARIDTVRKTEQSAEKKSPGAVQAAEIIRSLL